MASSEAGVLIVDEDKEQATRLRDYLSSYGFSTGIEHRAARALDRIQQEEPALVIVGLALSKFEGFEFCRLARSSFSGGIILLNRKRSPVDEVVGLELGADDYLVNPIDPRVLLARVRSLLRRLRTTHAQSASETVNPEKISLGPLHLERTSRAVRFADTPIGLTAVEFDVIWALARRAGRVVSRDQLYLEVVGRPFDGIDRSMDVHVCRLRGKLCAKGFDGTAIKAIRGTGYILVRNAQR